MSSMISAQALAGTIEDHRVRLADAIRILGVYEKQWKETNVIPSTDDESEDPRDSPWQLKKEQGERVDRLRRRLSELESELRSMIQIPEYPVTSVHTSSDGQFLTVVIGNETFRADIATGEILQRTKSAPTGNESGRNNQQDEKNPDVFDDEREDIPSSRFTHLEVTAV